MHKWYVVHVLSSHEAKVKRALEEQKEPMGMGALIARVVLPIENISEVKQGKQQVVQKRLWPGYLLMEMTLNDESWQYVKNTPGVIGFLGGDNPTPLTLEEVENIMADVERKQKTVTEKHKFQVGDRVKVVDGVFVNFLGTVTDVFQDKGRLSVLVSIFGRDTQVDDLEFHQVDLVTDEDMQ